MRDEMQVGDGVLFYHSNAKTNAVVGYATVARSGYLDDTAWDPESAHPDPRSTPEDPVWYMIDIKADAAFVNPVSLAQIRANPALGDMVLVNNSRLSVQPVTPQDWEIVVSMGMESRPGGPPRPPRPQPRRSRGQSATATSPPNVRSPAQSKSKTTRARNASIPPPLTSVSSPIVSVGVE